MDDIDATESWPVYSPITEDGRLSFWASLVKPPWLDSHADGLWCYAAIV
jgi:hypothetical protein